MHPLLSPHLIVGYQLLHPAPLKAVGEASPREIDTVVFAEKVAYPRPAKVARATAPATTRRSLPPDLAGATTSGCVSDASSCAAGLGVMPARGPQAK